MPQQGALAVVRANDQVGLNSLGLLLEPHMGVFSVPGVKHGIYNTELEDLVFIVVGRHPADMLV